MPNHCTNTLRVVGEPKEVQRFIETVTVQADNKERIGILHTIVPCPSELQNTKSGFFGDTDKQKELEVKQAENLAKYGFKDWYDWCIANWGTKWGDYDTEQTFLFVDDTKTSMMVRYLYTTAWSPAIHGLCKVSEKFPTLWFVNSFQEEGMDFMGAVTIHDGRIYAEDVAGFPEIAETANDDPNDEDAIQVAYQEAWEKASTMLENMEISQITLYIPEELQSTAFAD